MAISLEARPDLTLAATGGADDDVPVEARPDLALAATDGSRPYNVLRPNAKATTKRVASPSNAVRGRTAYAASVAAAGNASAGM